MAIIEALKPLGQFVPIMILAATFGATYVAGWFITAQKWLMLFLFVFGTVVGSLYYFTTLDPTALKTQAWYMILILAALTGGGYAGIEVLAWKYVAKKLFTSDGIVDAPKPPPNVTP